MEELYEYDNKATRRSATSAPLEDDMLSSSSPDEISLFLHQILLRSSSSSFSAHNSDKQLLPSFSLLSSSSSPSTTSGLICSSTSLSDDLHPSFPSALLTAVDSSDAGNPSCSSLLFDPSGVRVKESEANVSSTSADEYDCESEGGIEGLVEEIPSSAMRSTRSSSKRSRAAEVHNLSEKRRRSRINEKMKALQNLIPNSNKTDKASMLDEAIEYLKQLQLQVQMLSMRNGLSLHPILPAALEHIQLPQMRMDYGEENGSLRLSTTSMFNLLPNQCTNVDRINSETPLRLESSFRAHPEPFHLHTSANENRRENMLQRPQLRVTSIDSHPIDIRAHDGCSEIFVPKSVEQTTHTLPSYSNCINTGCCSDENIKIERHEAHELH